MVRILGISGSLRRASFNAALLRAAREAMPAGAALEIASIRGVPLYDGDLEAAGVPEVVQELKQQLAAAAALLIATPEYNNGIPGVLKNAIDWMSRPAADVGKVFRGKPVALIGATPGAMGTALAQAAWLPVLRTLGMHLYPGARIYVSGAGQAFAEDGRLADEALRERLQVFLQGFVEFVARAAQPAAG